MNPLKSPRSEGMVGAFYKEYWNIVGPSVVGSIQDFLSSAKFVNSINHTFVVLIPNKEGLVNLDHFKPISRCNFSYNKVLS